MSLPLDKGGWVLLGQREQDELALGLVGKFWRPVIEFPNVSSASEFRDFARPGSQDHLRAFGSFTRSTTHIAVGRHATTDEHARQWFRRY
jgi:hypothetical protein